MLKATLLAGVIAALSVAASPAKVDKTIKERDAQIIVEVDRDLSTLTEDGINNVQNYLFNSIRSEVTSNIRLLNSYTQIANAFAISINSDDIDAVRALPGVKSVTVNKLHWATGVVTRGEGEEETTAPIVTGVSLDKTEVGFDTSLVTEDQIVDLTATINAEEGAEYSIVWSSSDTTVATVSPSLDGKSATVTVKVAAEGSSTITIAVEDASGEQLTAECLIGVTDYVHEFGGRDNISAQTMNKPADTYEGAGTTIAILDNEFYFRGSTSKTSAWNHATYSALDPTIVGLKHYNYTTNKAQRPAGFANTHAAKHAGGTNTLGKEGSCYFNTKVPFYFDYGGETEYYSEDYNEDFDVSSEIAYHGSHVASIAAGNDEYYKGIAPNAQLFCMKVFTNFKSSGTAQRMGLSSSSGAYDIPIMNALEDCVTLKVDGINMSLGNNLDDFDKDAITNRVLSELAESGIMTSISAGNSGKDSYETVNAYKNWTTDMVETGILSGHSNLDGVMTVASGQPDKVYYESAFKVSDSEFVPYVDQIVNNEVYDSSYPKEFKMSDLLEGDKEKELRWVWVRNYGRSQDYDSDGDKYAGNIVVVSRGVSTFLDKYNQAAQRGAKAIVIINNDPTASDFNFRFSFGDGFNPTMPCALVLFKDRPFFEEGKTGTFKISEKNVFNNAYTKSVSSYSSDGATYDLDLKPDIDAPGENIRGAVPPQKDEDRTSWRRYHSYEFLSGTSMSAPNFAGAQSLVLSKVAGPAYATHSVSSAKRDEIDVYRNTVNMRLMSTAVPSYDKSNRPNPETNTVSLTSPRRQGAGMVDLTAAYNTKVYLEGIGADGNGIGKSKISLGSNADINAGRINLSFLTHNEDTVAHNYNIHVVIMRPAISYTDDIITKDFQDKGEVEEIQDFPGRSYWVWSVDSQGQDIRVMRTTDTNYAYKDVWEVTKDIEYYASEQDLIDDKLTTITKGKYYNAAETGAADWQPMTSYDGLPYYQTTQDVELADVELGSYTINPGDGRIDLNTIDIATIENAKEDIAKYFPYGCYLEGYVYLENSSEQLSVPYLGFYTGDESKSYEDAPVVEPFSFEKDETTVYPSDLVNSVTKKLIGKDNVDFGSMWVAGYVEPGSNVNIEKVLYNDDNIANLSGFRLIENDPVTGQKSAKLYAGAEYYSNTMIVQQFVMRSVTDNYFTITNKETGEVAYKSVLEDSLRGEIMNKYPLYKSHIDDSYLGSGIVAHRAIAVIPLYDVLTGEMIASGDYEITFNYLLAATNSWVSKSYDFTIDSEAPEVSSVTLHGDKVHINIKEANIAQAVVGDSIAEVVDGSYIEMSKDEVLAALNTNFNKYQNSGRLYVKLVDKAGGEMGAIIRFKITGVDKLTRKPYYDLSSYVMVEHRSLLYSNDFNDDGETLYVVRYNASTYQETEVELEGFVLISRGPIIYTPIVPEGCGGNIMTTSALLSIISGLSIALVLVAKKKRKILGGKN